MSAVPEAPPTTAIAVLSMKNPTGRSLWIAMCLVLISAQVLASLVVSAGEFIFSDHVLVTPFHTCLRRKEDGERRCVTFPGTAFRVRMLLGLYVPVVLVAFALLAMLLMAYTKERSLLCFSGICQAASSLLILSGIIEFLCASWPHVAWGHMTLWFYTCVGVQVELVVTAALTFMSRQLM